MTFIPTSKYIRLYSTEDKTQEEFLIIAIEAAKRLDWNIKYINKTGFTVLSRLSLSSWNEAFRLKIKDGIVTFKNEYTNYQMADQGQNKDNINNFISIYNELKNTFTKKELAIKYEKLKRNLIAKENTLKQNEIISIPATTLF